jgi:two-component system, NtrC family, sensor kinase
VLLALVAELAKIGAEIPRGVGVARVSAGKRPPNSATPRVSRRPIAGTTVIPKTKAKLKALAADRDEVIAQQTATAEVLHVISSSRGNLERVFETILERATKLCEAGFANLWLREGDAFRIAATHGASAAYKKALFANPLVTPHPESGMGRVLADHKPFQISDISKQADHGMAMRSATVKLAKARTLFAVPMLKDGDIIGIIAIYRRVVRPFTSRQIMLVQSFGAQAVLALENARLVSELRQRTVDLTESLQQQRATSDILEVISNSPTDAQPAFDAIVRSGLKLFPDAAIMIGLPDGDVVRAAAIIDADPAGVEALRARLPLPLSREFITSTAILERREVDVADAQQVPTDLLSGAQNFLASGFRAITVIPMMRKEQVIGALSIMRRRPGALTEKERELLRIFASQAVIAIENTRLFSELRQRTDDLSESLEQQTATSEVLKVISSSQGELEPVFDTILRKAVRICDAKFGHLWLREGNVLRIGATYGAPSAFVDFLRNQPVYRPKLETGLGQLMNFNTAFHLSDVAALPTHGDKLREATINLARARTLFGVPMLKDNELIGAIVIYRQEVRPFTDKQMELVANFAAQAVIAIENARLLNELRGSLEQQTATSEVLKVIASSTGELQPVFSAMLENSTRLCDASYGAMWLREGDSWRAGAMHGQLPAAYLDRWRSGATFKIGPDVPMARVVASGQPILVPDMRQDAGYLSGDLLPVSAVEEAGIRTQFSVPMVRDEQVIGVITIYRREVKPFSDKEVELVKNFAAQAVIAIENARLLGELRQRTDDLSQALDQQTATADLLQTISMSRGELQPVFDALLTNATRLCGAKFGNLYIRDGDAFRVAAMHNPPEAFAQARLREPLVRPEPHGALYRLLHTKSPVHVPDALLDEAYVRGNSMFISAVKLGEFRSVLGVPMLKEGMLVGAIMIYCQEARPFSERQIELVQSFAAQAVIAIENTRLLNELRESLQQQTATADVLKVISRSAFDLQAVFDTLVKSASDLCEANSAMIFRRDTDVYRLAANYGFSPEFQEWMAHQSIAPGRHTLIARTALESRTVHIPDVLCDPEYTWSESVKRGDYRTMLGVPLLREGVPIGVIAATRSTPLPFTDKQIELIETFADQAVIAIENVRLFEEVQARTRELTESLQQQTATADVLKVISRSAFDLRPVLDTLVESAARLCDADRAIIFKRHGEVYQLVAGYRTTREFEEFTSQNPIMPGRGTITGRAVLEGKTVHIPDVLADPEYTGTGYQTRGEYRSSLAVPLSRDGETIGVFTLMRSAVRPYTEKQIELVTTFADQAVIAIENVRLFEEVQARTRDLGQSVGELRALGEVTQAVNSSVDLETVLATIVAKATQLSRTEAGAIYVFEETRQEFRLRATYGLDDAVVAELRHRNISLGVTAISEAVERRLPIQVPDIQDDPSATLDTIVRAGFRALLIVPLLSPDKIVGALVVRRKQPGEFSKNTVELLQTFAGQSVLAIQNARLFESVEARTRELAKSLEDLNTAQDRLVQTQKLASLGQLTAGIAHEIKNPLNFVNNFSSLSTELIEELQELLQDGQFNEKSRVEIDDLVAILRSNLGKIEQHGKRADSIVKNMLLHSREGSGVHRPMDINALVEESLNLAYHGARAERLGFNITLERSFDPTAGEVDLFPQEITRVLLNLISNGFYAATKRKAEASGAYEPILATSTKSLGDRVEIRIRDNGIGIPSEVKDKIFNPFFTTKPAGEGTGLGLSLSHDVIVKQHAGLIEVDTKPGEFTEFRIVLPRTAASIANPGERA